MTATLAIAILPTIALAAPPDRQALRDTLKQLWDSLDSVAFRCEEQTLDDKGKLRDDLGFTRYDLVLASGGRRSCTMTAVRPTGEQIMERSREDGRRTYAFAPRDGSNAAIDRITVSNQENTAESYSGPMCVPVWVLTPGGKPLHTYLDADPELVPKASATHPGWLDLAVGSTAGGFRCELDPDHDWLPAKITIGDNFTVIEVEKFTRDQGRWFPQTGVKATTYQGKTAQATFRVDQLHINRPLPGDTFSMPTPVPGAIVDDRASNTTEVVGGLAAMKKLDESARRLTPRSRVTRPIVASKDPEPSGWPWILAAAAAIALLSAVVTAMRRGKPGFQGSIPGSR